MSLQLRTGNILDNKIGLIAHGISTVGVYGAGLALQIAKQYPVAKQSYMRKYKAEGWELGDVQYVPIIGEAGQHPKLWIANCCTQQDVGTHKIQLDYDALAACITDMLAWCKISNHPLFLPKIGCGLAGGDFKKVVSIIRECIRNTKISVTVYSIDGVF